MVSVEKRNELISNLEKIAIIDKNKRIIIKELDYSDNPIAPCKVAYLVTFCEVYKTKRSKCVYWNDAIGFQFKR